MANEIINRDHFFKQLTNSAIEVNALFKAGQEQQIADLCSDVIIEHNDNTIDLEADSLARLFSVISRVTSEKLRTVCIGTILREDLGWLKQKMTDGEEVKEKLLSYIANDKAEALSPYFWRAVAEEGTGFVKIAYAATRKTHPHEAANLLVKLGIDATKGKIDLDVKNEVETFLSEVDVAVRTTFLDKVRHLSKQDKKLLMSQLPLSLMAELDESSIEHKAKGFFYDEVEEKKKREAKSKDIFAEAARRLEKGEKPLE